jgi:hypothetical protein
LLAFFSIYVEKLKKKLLVSNAIVKGNWYNIMNTMNEIITGAFNLEMKEFFIVRSERCKLVKRVFHLILIKHRLKFEIYHSFLKKSDW